jgi:hypothetical protein
MKILGRLTAYFFFAVVILPPASAWPEMSGIPFSKYAGFENKWRLVSVRFRKDTNEMRFIYANELAWKSLESGNGDYPDGAVLGKIGVATLPDPAFQTSAEPSGARRYQLMVRDKRRYASTGGWGYALFDSTGRNFPENPETQVAACFACHQIVPERGQVFVRPMHLSSRPEATEAFANRLRFESRATEKLPSAMLRWVPSGSPEVRVIEGRLSKHLFQGTLDEIRPILAKEAVRSKSPAALISEDGQRFSLVFEDKVRNSCPNQVPMRAVQTVLDGSRPLLQLSFCEDLK